MATTLTREQAARLKEFVDSGKLSPEQQKQAVAKLRQFIWESKNIVSSPLETGVARIDVPFFGNRRGAGARLGQPNRNTDLDIPESRDSRMKRAAESGVDFRTGLGFKERLKIATAVNLPEQRGPAILQALRDSGMPLEDLPVGVNPTRMDPETGEFSFLRTLTEEDVERGLATPEEVGKYRWTTVDETGLGVGDIADLADIPETLAFGLSVVGDLAGRRFGGSVGSLAGETLGDYVGRRLGNMIEARMNGVELTDEQKERLNTEAMWASGLTAGVSTGVRTGMSVVTPASEAARRSATGEIAVRGVGDTERAAATARETADVMQDIEKMSGERIRITAGQATGDTQRLVQEATEESILPEKVSVQLQTDRSNNLKILQRSNDSVNARVGEKSPEQARMDVRDWNVAQQNRAAADNAERQRMRDSLIDSIEDRKAKAVAEGMDEFTPTRTKIPADGDDVIGESYVDNFPANDGVTDAFLPGVRWRYEDSADGTVARILTSNVAEKWQGTGRALYRGIVDDAFTKGHNTVSDSSVSGSASRTWSKLADEGYNISISEDAMAQVRAHATERGVQPPRNARDAAAYAADNRVELVDGDYVYKVEGVPTLTEEQRLAAIRDLPGGFDPEAAGATVQGMYDNLASLRNDLDMREEEVLAQLRFDPTTQTSDYIVNNSVASNAFGNQWRQTSRAAQQALTPGNASPAEEALAAVFKKYDEEGFSASLRDGQLDLMQAYRAYDDLDGIARATGNEYIRNLADALDSMLARAKITSRDGIPVSREWRTQLRDQRKGVRAAKQKHDELAGFVNNNIMLERGADGKYNAQSLAVLDKYSKMTAADKNYQALLSATRQSPDLQVQVKNGLWDLYKREVGLDEMKFDIAKHRQFMRQRSDLLSAVFGAEDFAQMASNPRYFREFNDASNKRLAELRGIMAQGEAELAERQTREAVEAIQDVVPAQVPKNITVGKIGKKLQSMDSENFFRTRRLMQEEGLWTGVQDATREEVRRTFEAGLTQGQKGAEKLGQYLDDNAIFLKRMFGEQYVSDLRTIRAGLEVISRGTAERAGKQEAQSGSVRVLRSLIGPLSKPQRFITAMTFNTNRYTAKGFFKAIDNPEDARRLVAIRRLDPRGLTAARQLMRLGLMDELGINGESEVEVWQNWRAFLEEQGTPMDPNVEVVLW